jgi:SHS2 domain-containing protein
MDERAEELRQAEYQTPCPGFSHAPHTADEIVIAKGRTLEEAFEQAALGVYEIITDTSNVEHKIEKVIEDEGLDLYQLLYKWIENLLFLTDTEHIVFSKFKVESIERIHEGSEVVYRIRGKAWGEQFNPEKHKPRTIVKAATYAMMKIEKIDGCWLVRFVVDI